MKAKKCNGNCTVTVLLTSDIFCTNHFSGTILTLTKNVLKINTLLNVKNLVIVNEQCTQTTPNKPHISTYTIPKCILSLSVCK